MLDAQIDKLAKVPEPYNRRRDKLKRTRSGPGHLQYNLQFFPGESRESMTQALPLALEIQQNAAVRVNAYVTDSDNGFVVSEHFAPGYNVVYGFNHGEFLGGDEMPQAQNADGSPLMKSGNLTDKIDVLTRDLDSNVLMFEKSKRGNGYVVTYACRVPGRGRIITFHVITNEAVVNSMKRQIVDAKAPEMIENVILLFFPDVFGNNNHLIQRLKTSYLSCVDVLKEDTKNHPITYIQDIIMGKYTDRLSYKSPVGEV